MEFYKHVLIEIRDEKADFEKLKRRFEIRQSVHNNRLRELNDRLQETCPHEEEEYHDSYCYHNNVDESYWTCKVCGKYLRDA